jgi:anti-sigma-K factor RskA
MAHNGKDNAPDGLAAEYVLGTLEDDERAEAERLLKSDPAFRQEVAAWYDKLDPLIDTVDEVSVPPNSLERVFEKIDTAADADGGSANVVQLKRKLNIWRGATAAATALAASLVLYIAIGQKTSAPTGQFVAVLETSDRTPAFVASIDLGSGRIDVVRLGSRPAEGRSYELWALGAGRKAPESLGVIDARADIPAKVLGSLEHGRLRSTVFAVSDEPAGGSPTGQPTGAVLFTGKIVPYSGR